MIRPARPVVSTLTTGVAVRHRESTEQFAVKNQQIKFCKLVLHSHPFAEFLDRTGFQGFDDIIVRPPIDSTERLHMIDRTPPLGRVRLLKVQPQGVVSHLVCSDEYADIEQS